MKAPRYSLTQEQIDTIVERAAEKAVEVYRLEERRNQKNRANESVRITRKKLQSYRRVKASLKATVEFTDDEKIELRWAFVKDLMGCGYGAIQKADDRIRAIENKRKRDLFEIQSIDRAVGLFKREADNSGKEDTARRYRVLFAKYICDTELSDDEIAKNEKVSKKTIERDVRISCEILSVYLLGM